MLFQNTVFIGIDPPTSPAEITYAALDRDLQLLALSKGELRDILAYTGGQQSAFVGVNGPRRPNQGLMERDSIRDALQPVPNPGRYTTFRVVEYLLFKRNLRIPRTDSSLSACPGWMRTGFKLYKKLEEFGYQEYPADRAPQQMLEVYPHASYAVLLERIPFLKKSLEGRIQRQLVLHAQGVDVPDPMGFFEEITRYKILQGTLPGDILYTVEELEALMAAYTAWKAALHPEGVTLLGEPSEGEVVLPVKALKGKYF